MEMLQYMLVVLFMVIMLVNFDHLILRVKLKAEGKRKINFPCEIFPHPIHMDIRHF